MKKKSGKAKPIIKKSSKTDMKIPYDSKWS